MKHEMVSPLFFWPPSVHHGPAAWLDPHGQLPPAPPPPPPPPRMCALTTVTVTVTAQWDGASVTRVATYSPPADRSLAHEACSATTIACARCTEVAMVRPHVGACCESESLAQTPVCPGMAMCTKCTHRESISGLVTVCRHSRQLEILKKLRGHRRPRHCWPMLSMASPVPHTPTRTPRAPCAAGHGTRMMGVSGGYIP